MGGAGMRWRTYGDVEVYNVASQPVTLPCYLGKENIT